jgi:GNAT superfamily N-acetyltransferase
MTSQPASVQARHDLTAEDVDALEDRLYAFNASRTGYHDGARLAFLARVEVELVGAVAGFTWGGVCELRQVWVHDAHRNRGLGSSLMRKAIEEARDRGCTYVFLATYDFQASAFYAKLGFSTIAEIRDKPLGHIEIVMRLSLGEAVPRMGVNRPRRLPPEDASPT